MVFGLIRKTIRKQWEKDMDILHKNLSSSFSNIRKDITEIHTSIQNHKELIDYFENRILVLENSPTSLSSKNNILIENIKKDLTSTQKRIFLAIYEIQNKTESDVCSLKSLSRLLYPHKKLSSIRSTISEYITILESQELITKKRIGKETYVTITEIGNDLLKKINKKKKQKIIQ